MACLIASSAIISSDIVLCCSISSSVTTGGVIDCADVKRFTAATLLGTVSALLGMLANNRANSSSSSSRVNSLHSAVVHW